MADSGMVPKGPRAEEQSRDVVRGIETAPGAKRGRGRPAGVGYDPETGEEHTGTTYKADASEVDVFGVVKSRGYSEDRFYTKSVDERGHREKISVWVPQGIDSQVYKAVSEVAEYTSVQSLIRDAILHRLEYIQRRYAMGEDMRRQMELERIAADMHRTDMEIDAMTEAVTTIDEKCQRAWDSEDWGLLAHQMDKASQTIDWLREPYKTRASRVLEGWRKRSRQVLAEYREQRED